ncbi:MAG TPA: bifunctional (p)ppGpp synthetase/guanosine-3',5'-bis(diphosphate) 3'-pyrophosphohydrolase [Candidatus Hydrogenedentes bacterium]|nr:bifunctional (p)ppGpp synthetase/guanosine-3',5'-bis(diphosphate) 3'-pyrophosphohydrolase [Candidatus Hydrogenedentota bacterium]HOL76883.1 bifunctional (p)ppGpp synthetase/guanosine-3',5'-bis(diphosphate) 3'-pyrophosphohydrolase [Candidatus Hydrogenedentota bacterium]HPO85535.1 bifunctional (p)ppGpp synthetase/guanosine-3',5'-bis(diphosphate) 3'-pyrophosphohydrolase [Candidatus Hydrogenedentota bacterium]
MRTEFAKLLKLIRKQFPNADLDIVRRAYRVANEAHRGQMRLSGDPYVLHCIEVTRILAQLGLDLTTLAAALLHDVLEDTAVTREQLREQFGDEVANLVEGVTKIGALNFPSEITSQEQKQAINLRKMLVATAQDVRVILIKLADRLHNMRTIEYLPRENIIRISRETLDIYAPLAHRLGIARWKWELEDHAFHQLHPAEYKEMAALVAMKRREREAWLEETCRFLEERLAEAEVNARVIGRPKHLYSIYQKMVQQGRDFDQVMDVLAVRIITQTVNECYNALGVVHHLWPPVPGRFKDYIAMPKVNMYQSIHTTVMRENGRPLEVQIRTEEMDRTAREGIAAHWLYKEGAGKQDPKLETQLKWLRQMFEWLKDAQNPEDLVDSVRRDMHDADVYVFTPKGEVKELPNGATPLDFAYAIHSDIGHHCIGARVNGRMVPLRYNLQTGDVVEILTSKNQHPHLDWLEIVVTGKARTRIRQKLREIGELEPLDSQIRRHVADLVQPQPKPQVFHEVDDATRLKMIRVDGKKGIAVAFAKCCNPMPGHPILGYATKATGITIHRADCRNFSSSKRNPDRILGATWAGDDHLEFGMRVTAAQRPNMLADITNSLRPMNISITRAQYLPGENGDCHFEFVFETADKESVEHVRRTIRTVVGVKNAVVVPPDRLSESSTKT